MGQGRLASNISSSLRSREKSGVRKEEALKGLVPRWNECFELSRIEMVIFRLVSAITISVLRVPYTLKMLRYRTFPFLSDTNQSQHPDLSRTPSKSSASRVSSAQHSRLVTALPSHHGTRIFRSLLAVQELPCKIDRQRYESSAVARFLDRVYSSDWEITYVCKECTKIPDHARAERRIHCE